MVNTEHYFEQYGAGPPMVFIHGSYATTSTWKKMIEQLSATHRCIAIKLPGHGGAPEPGDADDPNIETELAIVEAIIGQLTDEPVHLVGHSYGGVVALALALKGSVRVKQMTLFEPVAAWVLNAVNDTEMVSRVEQFLQAYREAQTGNIDYISRMVIDFWGGEGAFDPLPDFIKSAMELMVSNNVRHWDVCTRISTDANALRQCTIPAHLVYGTRSNPVAHAIADHLCALLPVSRKTQIEGASHFLVTSHGDECLAALV